MWNRNNICIGELNDVVWDANAIITATKLSETQVLIKAFIDRIQNSKRKKNNEDMERGRESGNVHLCLYCFWWSFSKIFSLYIYTHIKMNHFIYKSIQSVGLKHNIFFYVAHAIFDWSHSLLSAENIMYTNTYILTYLRVAEIFPFAIFYLCVFTSDKKDVRFFLLNFNEYYIIFLYIKWYFYRILFF